MQTYSSSKPAGAWTSKKVLKGVASLLPTVLMSGSVSSPKTINYRNTSKYIFTPSHYKDSSSPKKLYKGGYDCGTPYSIEKPN